ncbi:MAG: hypothetical protein RSA51_09330 [Niameybacter sp.]
MEIFRLMGSIFVDNEKANESISKTDKKAESLGTKFVNGAKTVGTWGLALGGACAAGATALFGVATQSATAADRIDKMSNKIGMSKQAFQEWDYVLGQNGMDVEKLQVGVKTLTAQMDAATQGNESAISNFERLGLSVTDTNGALKNQEEMTKEAIMALADMENGTEKARLATEMFGKAGIEMMPMLNGGAEGIAELTARSHELGLVMSDETVTAGVVLGDTIDDVKATFGAVVTKIGAEVMPIIQQLCDWVLANMPVIQEYLSQAFAVVEVVVSVAIDYVKKFIEAISWMVGEANTEGTALNAVWADIQEVFKETFDNIILFVQAFVEMFQGFWNAYGDEIMAYIGVIWENIRIVFDTVFKVINDLLVIFTALFKGDWEGLWEGVKQLCKDIWDGITDLVSNTLDAILEVLANIIPAMLEAGANIMNGIWEGLKGVWNNVCNWVQEKVDWLVDKLKFWDNGTEKMSKTTDRSGSGSSYTSGNSSSSNSTYNGSHANGLAYVPFDGYVAQLHQGERVLTKEESKQYTGNDASNKEVVVAINQLISIVKALPKESQRLNRMGVI